MPPKLNKVIRLDSMPLSKASFTPEGYLKDKPVLTSIGIFEYINPDGSVRRELRLPEDVFDKESLKSYKGKPIIITHEAGLVTKDNVSKNQIGTILTDGFKDGEDVRAEIVIHDTDAMKDCGFKELSLGYNLDLLEESGVWNGEHYDAVQKNIRINHLALVREARAGEQARLNIDGRGAENTLKGGKVMRKTPVRTHRADGILTPQELAKAIEEYKARRKMAEGNTDAEPVEETEEVEVVEPKEDAPVEEKVDFLKQKKVERDAEDEPVEEDEMKEMLVRQDEDMQKLFDIIDTLLAERAFDEAEAEDPEEDAEEKLDAEDVEFLDEQEEEEDAEDEEIPVDASEDIFEENPKKDSKQASYDKFAKTHTYDGCGVKKDAEELVPEEDEEEVEEEVKLNTDSVDKVVRQRIKLGMIGKAIHLDGLENMPIKRAKKAVIKAVRPSVNLDGKSNAYINAMYECALADIKAKTTKNADYQKRQMFNKDSASIADRNSSDIARQRMINRHNKK